MGVGEGRMGREYRRGSGGGIQYNVLVNNIGVRIIYMAMMQVEFSAHVKSTCMC